MFTHTNAYYDDTSEIMEIYSDYWLPAHAASIVDHGFN